MDTLIASKNWKRVFPLLMSIIIVVIVSLSSCKKPPPEPDYRDKWVGNYDFTIVSAIGYYQFDSGWNFTKDTVNFVGTIEKYDNDRLKITFKPNTIEPDFTRILFPLQINGLIYPRVCNFGDFDYPEFRCDKGGFSGCFSDNKISINYSQSAGHFGSETHDIQGIKINEK